MKMRTLHVFQNPTLYKNTYLQKTPKPGNFSLLYLLSCIKYSQGKHTRIYDSSNIKRWESGFHQFY